MSNSRVSSPPLLILRFRCIAYCACLTVPLIIISRLISSSAAVFKVINYFLNNLKEPHVNVCDPAA